MLQAAEGLPVNLGFFGKGNASTEALEEQVAPAPAAELHEDWGYPAIDACSVADRMDVQVRITDTLNEAGFVGVAAIKGRIHTFHTEGAGGGMWTSSRSAARPMRCQQQSPRPYTCNTLEEHLDMLMVCHTRPEDPEDVAFAESRIRRERSPPKTSFDLGAL